MVAIKNFSTSWHAEYRTSNFFIGCDMTLIISSHPFLPNCTRKHDTGVLDLLLRSPLQRVSLSFFLVLKSKFPSDTSFSWHGTPVPFICYLQSLFWVIILLVSKLPVVTHLGGIHNHFHWFARSAGAISGKDETRGRHWRKATPVRCFLQHRKHLSIVFFWVRSSPSENRDLRGYFYLVGCSASFLVEDLNLFG